MFFIFLIVSRTARGDNKGTALSFVSVKEMSLLEEVERELAGSAEGGDTIFKPYQFRMEEIEGFKYRAKVSKCPLPIIEDHMLDSHFCN